MAAHDGGTVALIWVPIVNPPKHIWHLPSTNVVPSPKAIVSIEVACCDTQSSIHGTHEREDGPPLAPTPLVNYTSETVLLRQHVRHDMNGSTRASGKIMYEVFYKSVIHNHLIYENGGAAAFSTGHFRYVPHATQTLPILKYEPPPPVGAMDAAAQLASVVPRVPGNTPVADSKGEATLPASLARVSDSSHDSSRDATGRLFMMTYTDGSCRCNPGPGGMGILIYVAHLQPASLPSPSREMNKKGCRDETMSPTKRARTVPSSAASDDDAVSSTTAPDGGDDQENQEHEHDLVHWMSRVRSMSQSITYPGMDKIRRPNGGKRPVTRNVDGRTEPDEEDVSIGMVFDFSNDRIYMDPSLAYMTSESSNIVSVPLLSSSPPPLSASPNHGKRKALLDTSAPSSPSTAYAGMIKHDSPAQVKVAAVPPHLLVTTDLVQDSSRYAWLFKGVFHGAEATTNNIMELGAIDAALDCIARWIPAAYAGISKPKRPWLYVVVRSDSKYAIDMLTRKEWKVNKNVQLIESLRNKLHDMDSSYTPRFLSGATVTGASHRPSAPVAAAVSSNPHSLESVPSSLKSSVIRYLASTPSTYQLKMDSFVTPTSRQGGAIFSTPSSSSYTTASHCHDVPGISAISRGSNFTTLEGLEGAGPRSSDRAIQNVFDYRERVRIEIEWVKGHSTSLGNKIVDAIATECTASQSSFPLRTICGRVHV